jgi:hypothetical protein
MVFVSHTLHVRMYYAVSINFEDKSSDNSTDWCVIIRKLLDSIYFVHLMA